MFNKTIFKQTLKANIKLWLIITVVLTALNIVLIAVFDPKVINTMTDMVKDTPLANFLASTSFLGMLSQSFYAIHAIILPLIFIILTANTLVVSQVDSGSMAYILSTPIKRSVVVRTQALYFVLSVSLMILIVTISGVFAIETYHGGVFGVVYSEDVKVVSKELNLKKSDVESDFNLILDNEAALAVGAEARHVDEDVYKIYVNLKIMNQAYEAAAEILGVEVSDITKDPLIIKSNEEALEAAANIMEVEKDVYAKQIDQLVMQNNALAQQGEELQDKLMLGYNAAANVLNINESDLISDLSVLKTNQEALDTAINESGIPNEMFIGIINNQIATQLVNADTGLNFNLNDYLVINLGLLLLMFATSGISFMFSCIFNLSKNYMAFGAGIPLAFFIIHLMSQVSEDLSQMKYLSLNSLFDTKVILDGGDYGISFLILGILGVVFYFIGMRVFKEKDLPL